MYMVKTYNGKAPSNYHFFVLSKGNNAGKPALTPFTNSFVVSTDDLQAAKIAYHACKALFITDRFKFYLRGSVIPFLVMKDFCTELKQAFDKGMSRDKETLKAIQSSLQFRKQLKITQDMADKLVEIEKVLLHEAFVSEPIEVYESQGRNIALVDHHVPYVSFPDKHFYVQGDAAGEILKEVLMYVEEFNIPYEKAIERYVEHYL